MIESFIIVYIALIIGSELASGTVFQHFFNAAKALFVVGYLMFSLRSGVLGLTFESVSVIVDLRLFLMIFMLLGLLGFAKTVMQAIDYMSEKSEVTPI